MNFFYTLNAKKLKQLSLILIISFFTALFIYSGSLSILPVFSTEDGPKAIYKGEKGIALTFNVGWGDEKAEPILEELEKQGVDSATFFLSGAWAERHPELVEKMVKKGYEIGSLGYAYSDYSEMEEEKIREDILKAQEVFQKLNIKEIKLLRVPTGHFDKKTLAVAEKMGLTVVHWSVNSQDWRNPGVDEIIKNVAPSKKGDIILLHASDSAKQTKDALPSIVKQLKGKGEFVTVSELIANGKTKTTLIP
ncbi:polysaccharide deacetylase family sporulation protein PdaB [Rossellomorea sp. BNER]|jgi:peptidoglycan-N-acetylglucosamine deacetylase|uniref:polysaccharide deacetylase family sporulation protein PdaB n=1 Tax=Rossellomorea sp. BNER TaxID=2962031 RepID=UPI003AF2B9EF|nr:polysaccharide deacetylase family sporulation protein PdaB [Rossellomorea sp. BNER]